MNFASCSFLLLLLFMHGHGHGHGHGAREMADDHNKPKDLINHDHDLTSNRYNVLRLPSMDQDRHGEDDDSSVQRQEHVHQHDNHVRDEITDHAHDHPSNSHMDHMNIAEMVFFTLNDLKVGKTMPIYFPKKDPSKSPHLLPREEAESIPFSLKQLPYLLQFFSFSQDSPQAKAIENTLKECETNPIKGETKFCATSLESMLDFARRIFGSKYSDLKIVATTHLTKSSTLFQNYTISETPQQIPAPVIVACHTLPYAYAVLYCHSQETENKVFKVSLGGENGDRVEALAVCHMDTSQWTRNHMSFRVLGIEPGTPGICHFFPADNFVLVPVPAHPYCLGMR
ncbi:hypothetical protein PTKIN_Ptkin10aG0142900 [Pterospermum kingtungense]